MRFTTIFFVLLLSLPCLLSLPLPIPHPSLDTLVSARLLDSRLQALAFKAFFRPRTGVPYDGKVPTNLTGVTVSAMRLKSGSLWNRGVQMYKEFEIPIGVIEHPYVERLVLVYHNLGNWSEKFYPLPGYTYLAPVVGLLAYSAANLSASKLPELHIRASEKPILVKFPHLKSPPSGSLAKCVYFDLHGSVQFDTMLPNNVCSTFQQGHFSIVVESIPPSHAPHGADKKNKSSSRVLIPCLVGGVLLLIILGLSVAAVRRTKQGTRIQQLECVADNSEALQMTSIGDTKAPLAVGTRTRPVIENDYIP